MAGPLLYPPSVNNLQKQLNADYTAGGNTITLNNTTNLQNKPGVALINRIDTNSAVQATSDWTYIQYTGTSGATLTGVTAISGDQDHATGEVVEFVPDVTWAQAIADALANLVNTTTLAVDTTKVVTLTAEQTLTNKTLTSPTLTTPSVSTGDVNLATGLNIQVNGADPYKTIVVPASAMTPTTTAGCAALAKVEAGTNDVDYNTLDFDKDTDEMAFFSLVMPDSWDGGTITFQPVWTAASGSGTACFGLKARAFADDDAIDQAYGTAQTSTDTLITAGDIHIGPASSAITVGGTPAGGQWIQFKVFRDVSEDDLSVDARLIALKIEYKVGQYSD